MRIEMNLGGVLVEACRNLVLRLFHGHAVDMIDLLANRIVFEHVFAAGEGCIPSLHGGKPGQFGPGHTLWQVGDHHVWRG